MGREVGKQILNIGIAVVIFVIIQPFIKHKIDFLNYDAGIPFLYYIDTNWCLPYKKRRKNMNETTYYILTFSMLLLSVLVVSGILLFMGKAK